MNNLTLLAVIGFAGVKLNDIVRYLRAGDWNGVLGTLAGWVTGAALVFLVSAAHSFNTWTPVSGLPAVGDMDWQSKLLLGAGIMSLVQVLGIDIGRKALDNTQSAVVPNLLNGTIPTPAGGRDDIVPGMPLYTGPATGS